VLTQELASRSKTTPLPTAAEEAANSGAPGQVSNVRGEGYALSMKGVGSILRIAAQDGAPVELRSWPCSTERPELDEALTTCLRPAVEATGFTLKLLYEEPKAGNIDDHLRAELLAWRFVIADLTHENRGAYWEAGFAEGARKPVIYVCKKEPHSQGSLRHEPPPNCRVGLGRSRA
jgi:hypothetical protein